MTTAFVLSGGGSLGATQVGMLAGLAEADVVPDLIVGTSVGAINGGWVAGRPGIAGVEALADLWRAISRQRIFPTRPVTGLLGLLGWGDHLVPSSGIRRLLEQHLRFARLEDARVPLHITATDVLTGREVLLSTGNAVDAITASSAIPGVLPPVRIDGRDLMDGGVANHAPISHAVALGADTIYVLATGFSCALSEPPRGALALALHGLTLMAHHRLAIDVERYESVVDLRVLPPLCPLLVSPADFSRSSQLIDGAHAVARDWLATRQPAAGEAARLQPSNRRSLDPLGVLQPRAALSDSPGGPRQGRRRSGAAGRAPRHRRRFATGPTQASA